MVLDLWRNEVSTKNLLESLLESMDNTQIYIRYGFVEYPVSKRVPNPTLLEFIRDPEIKGLIRDLDPSLLGVLLHGVCQHYCVTKGDDGFTLTLWLYHGRVLGQYLAGPNSKRIEVTTGLVIEATLDKSFYMEYGGFIYPQVSPIPESIWGTYLLYALVVIAVRTYQGLSPIKEVFDCKLIASKVRLYQSKLVKYLTEYARERKNAADGRILAKVFRGSEVIHKDLKSLSLCRTDYFGRKVLKVNGRS